MEGQIPTPPQPPQPPPPPQMPPQPPGGYMGQPPKQGASGMAIAALILSIAGIFCCGLASLVGLILGIMEKGKISRGESPEAGSGMAKAAVIISIIGLVLWVIGMILYVILVVWAASTPTYNY